jgi:hypothetical protein
VSVPEQGAQLACCCRRNIPAEDIGRCTAQLMTQLARCVPSSAVGPDLMCAASCVYSEQREYWSAKCRSALAPIRTGCPVPTRTDYGDGCVQRFPVSCSVCLNERAGLTASLDV